MMQQRLTFKNGTLLGVWLSLILCTGVSPCQQLQDCGQARVAYLAGRISDGDAFLSSCQKAGADDRTALLAQARALFAAGRLNEAEQAAEKLQAKDPQSKDPGLADALYLLGRISQDLGDARSSLNWYTKAAEKRTPQAEDLRSVGLDYALLNDYPDAIHWLRRASELDSSDAEAWYDLGRAYMMQADHPAAETALVTSLRLRPRSVKAEDNLGVTFEAENRMAEAIAAYRQAISWDQEEQHPSEQPFLNLGTLMNTQQRPGEAVPLLQRAVALAPKNAKAHEQLARALDATGSLTEALPEMQQAVQLAGNEARLHFELGRMYRRAGRSDEARKELELSQQLYGSHSTEAP